MRRRSINQLTDGLVYLQKPDDIPNKDDKRSLFDRLKNYETKPERRLTDSMERNRRIPVKRQSGMS